MGSITDALKAKGATGSNIAECIETLPSGGSGGDSAPLILTIRLSASGGRITMDKTWREIKDHVDSGLPVYCYNTLSMYDTKIFTINELYYSEDNNRFYVSAIEYYGGGVMFSAETADDYPWMAD